MLNGLDLFSGIGGLSLALSRWVQPFAYCESDRYCQSVLLSRISDNSLHQAPIWDDIRTFESDLFPRGSIDIIYGGFPCQDISVAGARKGLEGERSGLFWEMLRISKEIKPKFLFIENVPGILTKGGCEVVNAIAEMGYDCRWCTISAACIGAPHKREHWFLLAHANEHGCDQSSNQDSDEESVHDTQKGKVVTEQSEGVDCSGTVAKEDAANSKSISSKQDDQGTLQKCERRQARNKSERGTETVGYKSYWEEVKPPFCGVDDGLQFGSHRIKALGNAVVPQQAKEAFKILMGLK